MNITPTLEEVLAYTGDATHIAVSVELLVDTETPISLFQKLAPDGRGAFLLESAEGGETFGRYSFIGLDPAKTFRFSNKKGSIAKAGEDEPVEIELEDPLEILEEMLAGYRVLARPNLPRFTGGAVGYLGYDCVRYFENVPIPEGERVAIPEGYFVIAERIVVIDHLKHRVNLLDLVALDGDRAARYAEASVRLELLASSLSESRSPDAPFTPGATEELVVARSMEQDAYVRAVVEAKEAIAAGEIFQVVLSQRSTVELDLPPFELYRALRALNPSPYMFYFAFEDWAVVGASPEVLVRVESGEILLRPIAGTRARGATREEDEKLAAELSTDEKELAEHKMLLDLGRNDVGRVASVGSVEVARPLHIERYSHVMHLVSDVRGKVAAGKTAFDVLRACFPAGTVSGAPKIRAMEIISRLENVARGLYSGAVGYFDFGGNMDTCIAIRTLICSGGQIHVQAGAGLVYDSVPEKEHEECMNKAKSSLAAIALAKARVGARASLEDHHTDPVPVGDHTPLPFFGDDVTEETPVKLTEAE